LKLLKIQILNSGARSRRPGHLVKDTRPGMVFVPQGRPRLGRYFSAGACAGVAQGLRCSAGFTPIRPYKRSRGLIVILRLPRVNPGLGSLGPSGRKAVTAVSALPSKNVGKTQGFTLG